MKYISPSSRGNLWATKRTKQGFSLVEVMVAMTIFIIVIAALFSTVFAALKLYYVNSDYLDIGGQTRRLVDDMIETGTFADDLAILNDINDPTDVARSARGDLLMFYTRSTTGTTGNIAQFTCYYLARTPPVAGPSGPISVWRFVGIPGTLTPNPTTALSTYTKTQLKRVSSTVLTGALPRTVVSPTLRSGIFTNDGALVIGASPTVLVNLPASMVARVPNLAAGSNVTVAISPRH